jgi:transcriptional regulator with XRE-family HTH domain
MGGQNTMSVKSELINKLKTNKKTRESYVRAKLNVNLPSQIRALRLKQRMKQEDLAREAEMMQPRISAMERPGATKFNLETLIRLAAAFKVGLIVKFVSFSEMLKWENDFSQDTFNVLTIDQDAEFQREEPAQPAILIASIMGAFLPSGGEGLSLADPYRQLGQREPREPEGGINKFLRVTQGPFHGESNLGR